jgi:hypothetical protein
MEENVMKQMKRQAFVKGFGTMLLIWAAVELIGAFYRVTVLGLHW